MHRVLRACWTIRVGVRARTASRRTIRFGAVALLCWSVTLAFHVRENEGLGWLGRRDRLTAGLKLKEVGVVVACLIAVALDWVMYRVPPTMNHR
jgi:hypothetical protein